MITIVGGSGFVGTKLILKLKSTKCHILDKNNSHFFPMITTIGDIRIKDEIFFKFKSNVVILLAAEHRDDVLPTSLYYDVNVEGTRNVLEKMDVAGIKHLIFTSSVAIYGLNKINPDESYTSDPFNHYGKSKWEAEIAIKEWYDNDPKGKSVTIIRPTVIFGERNRGNVYNLLKQIASGKFLMIGNGQNFKSLAYVDNVVAFIKHRIEKNEPGYHVFNYADKPDFSMNEMTSIIQKKLNLNISKTKMPYWLGMIGGYMFDFLALVSRKKLPISSVRVKKFCATTQFDASKAHAEFKPPFTLEEGLNRTLEYDFINRKEEDELFYSE